MAQIRRSSSRCCSTSRKSGESRGRLGLYTLPRTLQWNLGVQRRLLRRAVVDVSYIGSRGEDLIQPVDINAALPADVVAANGALNLARPYQCPREIQLGLRLNWR